MKRLLVVIFLFVLADIVYAKSQKIKLPNEQIVSVLEVEKYDEHIIRRVRLETPTRIDTPAGKLKFRYIYLFTKVVKLRMGY